MTIPFLDLFNKLRTRFQAKPAQPSAVPRKSAVKSNKPGDQHFRKTVMPNTTRSFAPPDPFRAASGGGSINPHGAQLGPTGVLSPSGPTISRTRDLPRALALALEPKVERVISMPLSDFIDQVPAEYIKPVEVIDAARVVALKASEIEKGMPDRNPSVALASLYQQVPEIFLRSVAPSDATRVSLPYEKILQQVKNARVRDDQERDQRVAQFDTPILQATIKDTERFGTKMAPLEGADLPPVPVKPATAEAFASAEPEPVASHKQEDEQPAASKSHPVISLRPIQPGPESDPTEPEPFISGEKKTAASEKQKSSETPQRPPVISLRSPEPEPFIDPDNPEPFITGETKPAVQGKEKSPKTPPPASPRPPVIPLRMADPDREIEPAFSRDSVPPDFPPNGTGEPASERVPASSGPPVPNLSRPPEKAPPKLAPIAFEIPDQFYTQEPEEPSGSEGKEACEETRPDLKIAASAAETKIALALKTVLQNVPAFQLSGDTSAVGEEARIEFPLALVRSQLAAGRVSVPAKLFKETLPATCRELFVIDPAETPVSLPLQEVLKNLPSDALKIRADQEVDLTPAKEIQTPFSLRAEEDAKRFEARAPVPEIAKEAAPQGDTATKPELKPTLKPEPKAETVEPKPQPQAATAAPVKSASAKSAEGRPAPAEKIDGKEVVVRACRIAGVSACEIVFPDGLSLAGNFPAGTAAEALCAMAPMVLQRIDQHMAESSLGPLKAMTLHSNKSSLTFFMKGSICLAALHEEEGALAPETRAQLEQLVEKLSHTYAQPELPHVDH